MSYIYYCNVHVHPPIPFPASSTSETLASGPPTKCARTKSDSLIPIRLDLTVENHRIQKTITWNATETHITAQTFATILCSDLNLPKSERSRIAASITEQIVSFVPHHQTIRECRHVLRLDLRTARVVIRDQFEWDLFAANSPEAFVEAFCAYLGLATEHVPAVAHAIIGQLLELPELSDKRAACPVLCAADVVRKRYDNCNQPWSVLPSRKLRNWKGRKTAMPDCRDEIEERRRFTENPDGDALLEVRELDSCCGLFGPPSFLIVCNQRMH